MATNPLDPAQDIFEGVSLFRTLMENVFGRAGALMI
jgi:hypothetical protein